MSAEFGLPAIRFDGFSGEWVSSSLGQLLDITSAARVHKEEWTETGVPFFRTSDVVSIYKGQENKKAYISFKLYEELSAKVGIVRKDDLLITGGGSIGIPFLIKNNEPLYFKDADLLWLKNTSNTNGYLLYTFFSSPLFRKYIFSISHIGTISHYTIEQAKSTPIQISKDIEEQTKIGNYFQQIDTLIAQHQQKHNKLLNLKKALSEKMFSKQDATKPEIRFKGFSGEWEDKALGAITPLRGGFAFQSSQFCNNGIPVVKISNILPTGEVGGVFKYYEEQEDDQNYSLPNQSALLAMSGATTGKVSILKFYGKNKVYQNQRVGYFEDKGVVNYSFISTLVRSQFFSRKLSAVLVAGAQPNVSSKEIDSFEFNIPTSIEEQTKIGKLFKQLDTLITQQQAQLKKLSNIKQACLDKMFV